MRWVVAMLTGMWLTMTACNPRYDFGPSIQRLDSLTVSWSNEWGRWSTDFYDSLPVWADSARAQLVLIQQQFKGKMPAEQALRLSEYHQCKAHMEEIHDHYQRAQSLQTFEMHSMEMLKKALTDKATHDAQGNEITPEYVQRALQLEMEDHGTRIEKWKKVHHEARNARDLFHDLQPRVQSMVDSLVNSRTQ
jgi:hypothetical protein